MTNNELITVGLSSLAILVSVYTFWDSNYVFKLHTNIGKNAKLSRINIDGISYPLIMLNVSFMNNGGRTDSIEDTKLKVKISSAGIADIKQEFITAREFTDIFNDTAPTTEILPIIVNGKSNTVKKYAYNAFPNMTQAMIPATFDIKITLFVKIHGSWIKQKSYKTKDISGVWHDLNNTMNVASKIINLEEVN